MLSHISQENDKLNGALDGAAGLCWYEDSKLQTPLFVGQFDGTAEQAQLPGKLFTQNIGAHESKAPEGVLPISQTQQGEAQIWRREVSSRYGQYPKAQAAQPDQLMSDYFFRVSLAIKHETLGHLVVAFFHQCHFHLVLDVFHLDALVYVEVAQYAGDTTQVSGFVHGIECLDDGVHDFVKTEAVCASVSFCDGEVLDFHCLQDIFACNVFVTKLSICCNEVFRFGKLLL